MFKLGFAIWLVINVWATSFVSRKIEDAGHRIAYYALIWCIPLFGAVAVTIIAAHRALSKNKDAATAMLNGTIEPRKRSGD
jgi:hypothetical protein